MLVFIMQCSFLYFFLRSAGAYSVWMTREASLALEVWTSKYVLSHQHIRALHPEKGPAGGTDGIAHAASVSILVDKLNDQGWCVF
jgi:hypothetical protein